MGKLSLQLFDHFCAAMHKMQQTLIYAVSCLCNIFVTVATSQGFCVVAMAVVSDLHVANYSWVLYVFFMGTAECKCTAV